jgi:hypothetical protein
MMLIEYLNKLTFDGTIDTLYKHGIIPYHYVIYRDIYNHRELLLKQGYKRTESVYMISVMFGLSYRTVYLAIKEMQKTL